MRLKSLSRVGAVLASGALAAGMLAVSPAHATDAFPPVWDHGPGGERYVAFGDSFVAGPGISPVRNAGCQKSERNFPSLIAAALNVNSFTDASCAGATTADYWAPQVRSNGHTNPAQLDALSADTTLVTIGTMGGNDVGLVDLATKCVVEHDYPVGDPEPPNVLGLPGTCTGSVGDSYFQAIDALKPTYEHLIDEVRTRAPNALIIAVGYSTYMPDTSCYYAGVPMFGLFVTAAEATYLQDVIDHLSDTIRAAAQAKGVAFADLRTMPGVMDHTACAASGDQWVRGAVVYDNDGAQLHPTSAGHVAMSQKILETIKAVRNPEPVPPVTQDPKPTAPVKAAPKPKATAKTKSTTKTKSAAASNSTVTVTTTTVAAASASSTGKYATLPNTGSDVPLSLTLIAGASMVGGAALMLAGRRRARGAFTESA